MRHARATLLLLVLQGLLACPTSTTPPPAPTGACPLPDELPFTLAEPVDSPDFLAVDGERVYWLANSGLFSVKKDGAELRQLPLTGPADYAAPAFGQFVSGGLAVDQVHVYFAAGGTVYRVLKGGGPLEVAGTTGLNGLVGQVALDAHHVYWVDTYSGAVHKAAKGVRVHSIQSTLVTAGDKPRALVLDETHVYWSDGHIFRAAKDGSGLVTLVPDAAASGFAVDATRVYWLSPGFGVYRMDLDGQNRAAVFENHSPAFKGVGLTQDATRLYFSMGNAFASVNKTGGGYEGDPGAAGGSARGIAVDAEAVYWSRHLTLGQIQKRCVATSGVPADPSADASDAGAVVVEGPPGNLVLPASPTQAVFDDTHAFAVTAPVSTDPRNQVLRLPLTGGAPTVLEDNQNLFGTSQLARDPQLSLTHLYWVQSKLTPMVGSSPQWRYSIRRVEKSGGPAVDFTTPSPDAVSELMVTATHVYWFGHDALFRQGFLEAAPTSLASITSLTFFGEVGQTLLDGDTIYFEKSGRLHAVGIDGSNLRQLGDAQLPPGGPSPYSIRGLVSDATDLFWTYSGSSNSHDLVVRMPKTGGTPVALATQMQTLYDLAVDDTNVYWRLYGVEDVYAVPKAGGARRTVAMGGSAGSIYSSVTVARQRLWWTSSWPAAIRSIGL